MLKKVISLPLSLKQAYKPVPHTQDNQAISEEFYWWRKLAQSTPNTDIHNKAHIKLHTIQQAKSKEITTGIHRHWAEILREDRDVFRSLKNAMKDFTHVPIVHLKEGSVRHTLPNKVKHITYSFYEELLQAKPIDMAFHNKALDETYSSTAIQTLIHTWEEITKPISPKDVHTYMHNHEHTSLGTDKITPQIILQLGTPIIEGITKEFNLLLSGIIPYPEIWNENRTSLIFKSGDHLLIKNYRPITIQQLLCRCFWSIITKRLTGIFERAGLFPDFQYGFRPGHHIRAPTTVQQIAIEMTRNLYILALDIRKVFDSVQHVMIFNTLKKLKAPNIILQLFEHKYERAKTTFLTGHGFTKWLNIGSGILQGAPESPLIYLLCVTPINVLIKHNISPTYIFSINSNLTQFADDTDILSQSYKNAAASLEIAKSAHKAVQMQLATEKTQCVTNSTVGCLLSEDHTIIETQETQNSLGINIYSNNAYNPPNKLTKGITKFAKWAQTTSAPDPIILKCLAYFITPKILYHIPLTPYTMTDIQNLLAPIQRTIWKKLRIPKQVSWEDLKENIVHKDLLLPYKIHTRTLSLTSTIINSGGWHRIFLCHPPE